MTMHIGMLCVKCNKKRNFGVFCYYHYLRHTYHYHKKLHVLEFTIEEFVDWGLEHPPYTFEAAKPVALTLKERRKEWMLENIKWVTQSKIHRGKRQRKAREGYRVCIRCEISKALNDKYFKRDRTQSARFSYFCKKCANDIQKDRYHRLLIYNDIP